MSSANRQDTLLGGGVLLALLGLAWITTRADRPIRGKGPLLDAVQRTLGSHGLSDAVTLPLFDAQCDGTRIRGADGLADVDFRGATLVLCHLEAGGTVGIREDRPTGFATAGVYPFPGEVLAGGRLAPSQGILLFPDGNDGLRWTTSHRRARELGRSTLYKGMLGRGFEDDLPQLAFGHTAWPPGQLEAEIIGGAWTVIRD